MATRGKEVQDFIRSQSKSAREMFEELGFNFDQSISLVNFQKGNIMYSKYCENERFGVLFKFENKTYALIKFVAVNGIFCKNEQYYVDSKLNKAIQQQLKELGWL